MTEELKALLERQDKNIFAKYNHVEVESAELDKVVYKLEINPDCKNFLGFVHGGALYTMADNAAGGAAHTDGRRYVTQTSSMYYLSNQSEGTIRATGRVIHRGRATCLVRVEVTGDNGKLLCMGEFTFFCLDSKKKD